MGHGRLPMKETKWCNCMICGAPQKVTTEQVGFGHPRNTYASCKVCHFQHMLAYYEKQLYLDFRNLISVRIRDERVWIVDDEERSKARVQRTLTNALKTLGEIEARKVLRRAQKLYWDEVNQECDLRLVQ